MSSLESLPEVRRDRAQGGMTALRLSEEGEYLAEISMTLLKRLPSVSMPMRLCDGTTETGKFSAVSLDGKAMWANRITGSLFDAETGMCLSGDIELLQEAKGKRSKEA